MSGRKEMKVKKGGLKVIGSDNSTPAKLGKAKKVITKEK